MCCHISSGGYAKHVIIRLADGSFYGWGRNRSLQLGIGDGNQTSYSYSSPFYLQLISEGIFADRKIHQIACGEFHTVFLTADGCVYACGSNKNKQCGIDHNGQLISFPTKIGGVLEGVRIKQIAVGTYHTLCLSDDHNVYAFGSNQYQQLGFESDDDKSIAMKVTFFNDLNAKQIIAERHCSAVIVDDGKCFMFGCNDWAQLFTVEYKQTIIKSLESDVQLTMRSFGDFSVFDDNNDTRILSNEEKQRLKWIFSEDADMKIEAVAFGDQFSIITANINLIIDGNGNGDDQQREQILLCAGNNSESHSTTAHVSFIT